MPDQPSDGAAFRADRLDALTSLRFVAAACIVVHHTSRWFPYGGALDRRVALDQAVSFFFVLSGFILTYAHGSLRLGDAAHFWRARAARLWPVHVATFLLVVMLLPGAHPLWVAVVNLLLLQAWSTTLYFSYNGPSWTISTEAAFYVAFPLLVQRWSRTWPWKLALAFALMTAIVAYCNHLNHARTFLLVHLNPLARLFEFVLGMTATLAWRRLDAASPPPWTASALQVAAGAVVVAAAGRVGWSRDSIPPWVGHAGDLWLDHGGLACVPFAALIVAMALREGIVARLLSQRPLVLLGEISFSLYLIHHPLLRLYLLHRTSLPDLPPLLAYVTFWTVSLLASYLSWRLIERPCRRWLRGDARWARAAQP